jgi:hypothetical protein
MDAAPTTAIAVLGIAATLAVAAITGLIKLTGYYIKAQAADVTDRLLQRQELGRLVNDAEMRISQRLDRLEGRVRDLRVIRRTTEPGGQDDGNGIR